LLGALSIVLSNFTALLLRAAMVDMDIWGFPTLYLLLVGMIVTIVLQVHLLNQALQRHHVLVVFPCFQGALITSTTVECLLVFHQSTWVLLGLLLLLLGTGLLARTSSSSLSPGSTPEPMVGMM